MSVFFYDDRCIIIILMFLLIIVLLLDGSFGLCFNLWFMLGVWFMYFLNFKIKQKVLIGFVLFIILFVVFSVMVYWLIGWFVQISYWVKYIYKVFVDVLGIVGLVVDMEIGMCGYLLVGKEEFFDFYNSGEVQIYKVI